MLMGARLIPTRDHFSTCDMKSVPWRRRGSILKLASSFLPPEQKRSTKLHEIARTRSYALVISWIVLPGAAIDLPLILPLDRINLRDAFAVTIFGDLSPEPGPHNLAHLVARDRLAAQRQHVGVVVLAGVARDFDGITCGGAHAGNLVRRHRGTNTRAVDDDTDID